MQLGKQPSRPPGDLPGLHLGQGCGCTTVWTRRRRASKADGGAWRAAGRRRRRCGRRISRRMWWRRSRFDSAQKRRCKAERWQGAKSNFARAASYEPFANS